MPGAGSSRMRSGLGCLVLVSLLTVEAHARQAPAPDDVLLRRVWTTQKLERWLKYAQKRLTAIPTDAPAESHQGRLRSALKARIALFEELLSTRKSSNNVGLEKKALEEEKQRIEAEMGALKGAAEPTLPRQPDRIGLEKLEKQVNEVRARLAQAERLSKERASRLEALPREREAAQNRQREAQGSLERLPERLDTVKGEAEKEYLDLLIKNARLSKRLAHEHLLWLEREQDLLLGGREVDEQRLQRLQLELTRAERALSLYRQARGQHLDQEVQDRETELARMRSAAEQAKTPEERFKTRWQARLAEEEASLAELERTGNRWSEALSKQERWLKDEREELEALRDITQNADASYRVGERLKTIYGRLRSRRASVSRPAIPGLADRLDAYRTQQLEVQEQLRILDEQWQRELDAVLEKLPQGQRAGYQAALLGVREKARNRLVDKRAQLQKVVAIGDRFQDAVLGRLETLDAVESLVLSRVFWIRDARPLGAAVFFQAGEELDRLVQWLGSASEAVLGGRLTAELSVSWLLVVAALLLSVPVLLVYAQRRLRRAIRRRCEPEARPKRMLRQKIWLVFLAALSAAPLAAYLVVLGWWVDGADWDASLDVVLAQLLLRSAGLLFVWQLVRVLLAGGEQLLAHLVSVRLEATQLLYRFAKRMLLAYVVTLMPAGILTRAPFELDALPRLAYTAFLLLFLVALFPLVRKSSPLVKGLIGQIETSALWRAWGLLSALLMLVLAGIVAMDVLGYRFGSAQLATSAVLSLVTVPLLAGVYRLSLGVIRQVALGRLQSQTTAPGEDSEDRWTFESKLRRFLKTAFFVLGFVLLAVFWGLGSGVLEVMDGLEVLSFQTASGAEEIVSVGDLLMGLLLLLVTIWIVRNLKSIFDAFVFPYVLLDSGTRYAFLTITRWALFVVGLLIALTVVHLDLMRLGWLMAAMGVGIGFGLQEIVANMVSGVILLIERPVRVGDVLSVGDISGEVKRINIRATTILNWDRQEVIVPNKDFVTKEVTNWTLADKVLRLIIPIGVAYGSDVERVRALLIEIARSHNSVRGQPPPAAYFVGHGDSSLDFKLHVYVSDPAVRFAVIDQLNTQINKALAEQGIEIPFPQRDIHIRSDDTKEASNRSRPRSPQL